MDVFLDTGVIIDYLTDRQPFAEKAEKVLALIENKKIKGYASSLCFSNLYYLLRQQITHHRTLILLKDLSGLLGILKVDEDIIQKALESDFKDFGDAIQYFTATAHKKMEVIVTRNIKDYRNSALPVINPETLVRTYNEGFI